MTRHKETPASLYGWYPDYVDPDDYTYPFLHTGSNRWLGCPYNNSALDKKLEQAEVATDTTLRGQLYAEIQDTLAEDAPIIPIFQGKLYVVSVKGVKGIILDPVMLLRYFLMYKEVS